MDDQRSFNRKQFISAIHVRGTHYEVGYHVGSHFKADIEDFLATYKLFADLIEAYNTVEGEEVYEETYESVMEVFPQYIEELRGIANGAQVEFFKLFLLHSEDLMYGVRVSLGMSPRPTSNSIGCTSILCNKENNKFLAHNEDAQYDTLNSCYVIQAHIVEDDKEKEKFIAYAYPGTLPGFCSGFSYDGMAFSINVLTPYFCYEGGIPRHFYCRALLSCYTMADAVHLLQTIKIGCSEGFSVNMVDMGTKQIRMCNVEVAPGKNTLINIHPLDDEEFYVHTNKYRRLKVKELATPCSNVRAARIEELPDPEDFKTIVNILGDDDDPVYPIFKTRCLSVTKDVESFITVSVSIFDILDGYWYLYKDNPKTNMPIAIFSMKAPHDHPSRDLIIERNISIYDK